MINAGDSTMGRENDNECRRPPRFCLFYQLSHISALVDSKWLNQESQRRDVPSTEVEPSVSFTSRSWHHHPHIDNPLPGSLHHWHQRTDGRAGGDLKTFSLFKFTSFPFWFWPHFPWFVNSVMTQSSSHIDTCLWGLWKMSMETVLFQDVVLVSKY